MSPMFERLKRLYDMGKIDEDELTNAVEMGWITEEEKEIIMGANYSTETESE